MEKLKLCLCVHGQTFENNGVFFNVLLDLVWNFIFFFFFWKSIALQYQRCLKALSDLPKLFITVKQKKVRKKPVSKVYRVMFY